MATDIKKAKPSKILVFTKNWLGDVMFETPAIHEIKRNFPSARLVVVTAERCREIAERNPYVDKVITFDEKKSHRNLIKRFAFAYELRRENFTHAFLFHRSFTRAFLCSLAGIHAKYGYATKGRGWLLSHGAEDKKEPKHHMDYFLDLLRHSGFKVSDENACEFYFTKRDREAAGRLLEEMEIDTPNIVAIHPGANTSAKRWPPECFAQLADLLAERYHSTCVVTGTKADEALFRAIQTKVRISSPVSLCGRTGLGSLGAFFSMCRLVISGDTGPLHIAAGVGTNVLALFGPTSPAVTGPRGRGRCVVLERRPSECGPAPCDQTKCKEPICLAGLKPEEVFKTIEKEHLLF
ncbi:MAG: lipopolysaccharide heptosyltransferase II [Candidatus Omnitrophica bacterium]|nr:lipopolysaccharide heptosyltransferase II [Candidatus Omnitrophota bacterium]